MVALRFYDVILSVHVMAVVVAFGVVFTYPVVLPWLRRHHPGSMAVAHQVQGRLGSSLISPAAALALLAGAYLATDGGLWSEVWVTIPLVILLAILGVGGAVFAPTERRLAALASGGVDSPEYDAAFKRVMPLYVAVAVAVLVAIFLMVTKVGS
jgi:hypothetical protein